MKSIPIVNLTPHDLTVLVIDEAPRTIPPSGLVARVAVEQEKIGDIDGIPVFKSVMGGVYMSDGSEFPSAGNGFFITSLVVAQAMAPLGRIDILSPGTLVRDDEGRPVGCMGLSSYVKDKRFQGHLLDCQTAALESSDRLPTEAIRGMR